MQKSITKLYLGFSDEIKVATIAINIITGLSLRAGGRGFSPGTKRVAPGYFYWKIVEK